MRLKRSLFVANLDGNPGYHARIKSDVDGTLIRYVIPAIFRCRPDKAFTPASGMTKLRQSANRLMRYAYQPT
ncbi:hypothetical protein ACLK1T_08705 [Escherichia coli]